MPLTTGDRLGPYEIVSPLGAGGMGEVYKARDTRLERTVAIKVLPSHLAHDPALRQRFEREARAVSSLNHPHICTLHDVGEQNGVHYLVMEYIDGEPLSARLERGALPLDEALLYAIQIADALDRAHRQGVVHRDLKPGNIMLTRSGAKLLDFGLAKSALEAAPPISSVAMTHASPLTAEGTIVGTFQYMAPEQLEGRAADARSDIFSFGALLYEMVTGRRAFPAASQASLIAAIMEREPPAISVSQPGTPRALDRIVRTCLAKDPDARWQTAHDLRLQLQWLLEGGGRPDESAAGAVTTTVAARRPWAMGLGWGLAILLGLAVTWLALRGVEAKPPASPRLMASILPPPGAGFDVSRGSLALSPDGTRLIFAARGADGIRRLWLRPLDGSVAQPLAGTEDGLAPFWSPDGRSLAFFAGGELRKLDVARGLIEVLAEATGRRIGGGTWNAGGDILFSGPTDKGLLRVGASGGPATPVTALEVVGVDAHAHPWFLPDGRHFLFLRRTYGSEERMGQIRVGSLAGGDSKLLFPANSGALYSPTGHVIWWHGGNLRAQRFDPDRLEMVGEAFPLVPDVRFDPASGYPTVALSLNGLLVFQQGDALGSRQLTWVDRSGKAIGTLGQPGNLYAPRISPDGQTVALDISGETNQGDIWLLDRERGSGNRFTVFPEDDSKPIWSPDGGTVLFFSSHGGDGQAIYARPTRGGAEPRLILGEPKIVYAPDDWSRDGSVLLQRAEAGNTDLWVHSMADGRMRPWVVTPFNESDGRIAPGGRYVVYTSDETGRPEVYVQTFPTASERWSISTEGGQWPVWRSDGTEIYYLAPDHRMMAVAVRGLGRTAASAGTHPEFGAPLILFRNALGQLWSYDTLDGESFLLNHSLQVGANEPLTVIVNWPAGLEP